MIVAAVSPSRVLLSPGTIERPVAPGTSGLAAGSVTPAPGPATMFADGDSDAADEEPGMLVHAPRLTAIANAVKVVAILFITTFPSIDITYATNVVTTGPVWMMTHRCA
jgi:hypothetical protein